MQNTESNPNNALCSLEQRLNSLFDELKYQRKIFDKIANQNAILMIKVNAIEQFIYQYMQRNENKESMQKKRNQRKVHFISKTKENAKKSPEKWQMYIEKKINSLPFKIGYLGEAYVYESLLKMKCFSKVSWNANTKDENNLYVTLNNGNRYFIDEDGDHYDIVAEDSNNIKYYFEIKSTQNSSRNYNIKKKQRDFYAKLNPANNICVVAVVKMVLESPSITYCLYDPVNETCKRKISEKEAEENFMKYIAENWQNETSNEIDDGE